MKKNIIHITPHLGGGVGTVLLNMLLADVKNIHNIITLDYANENALKVCRDSGINILSQPKTYRIFEEIEKSDITVFHIWNHPLLYNFLIRNPLPPSRVIFWLHTAGLNLPYVFPEKLLNYPDICVLSTPLTYKTPEIQNIKDKTKLKLIWATGGCQNVKNITKKQHSGFNIGYVGTVDYFRLHKDFINTLSQISIPDAKFIICGGPKEKSFSKEADEIGSGEKFIFTGEVKDVKKYFQHFDIFAYMLSPAHCGSCDQALQEAMAAGIVPVVMNNPMENSMVKHNKTGLIANTAEEFKNYIELLYCDPKFRSELSKNAIKYAEENFSLSELNTKWNKIYNEIITSTKTPKFWHCSKKRLTSYDIFLESLGAYKDIFMLKSENEIKKILKHSCWQSDNKGTPKQYFKFLGGKELKRIVDLYE